MLGVSDEHPDRDPFGGNPFGAMPFFGDLARMMQSQGSLHWDSARQFAHSIAAIDGEMGNIEPTVRISYEHLSSLADMHVRDITGLELTNDGRPVRILPVTAAQWSQHSLDAYKPLFEHLATSLHPSKLPTDDTDPDPTAAMMQGLMSMMSPVMLGMAAGSLVGHLSQRSFGDYDLPIPRPTSDEIQVVSARIDSFGEDWSLDQEGLRLWVCVHQLTSHAVLRVPHIKEALADLLTSYAKTFRPDPDSLARALGDLEDGSGDPTQQLQAVFSRPELLLGAATTPEQQALVPRLDALVAVIVGYIDHAVDRAAARLIGPGSAVSEAVRRRRLEPSHSDQFVDQLLGLRIGRAQVDRGAAFVKGVIEREPENLSMLLQSAVNLPTPAELDAPGLWLARLSLTDDPD